MNGRILTIVVRRPNGVTHTNAMMCGVGGSNCSLRCGQQWPPNALLFSATQRVIHFVGAVIDCLTDRLNEINIWCPVQNEKK